jgi:hypothetical protein
VDVVEIVEMNDDVLEEGSAVRYQILPKKSKLRYYLSKRIGKIMRE